MKKWTVKIDRAIKDLYNLNFEYFAEDFFLASQPEEYSKKAANRNSHGAFYLLKEENSESLDVGIYIHQELQEKIKKTKIDQIEKWKTKEYHAIAVLLEEISHFHYYIFHSLNDRNVSQIELELQAEIDKFLVLYFLRCQKFNERQFNYLFDRLFIHFSVDVKHPNRERYVEANRLAKKFIRGFKNNLENDSYEKALKYLRNFYRLSLTDKINCITRL